MPVLGYCAWICEACSPVADENTSHQSIEDVCFSWREWSWLDAVEQPLRSVGQERDQGGDGGQSQPLHQRQILQLHYLASSIEVSSACREDRRGWTWQGIFLRFRGPSLASLPAFVLSLGGAISLTTSTLTHPRSSPSVA